MAVCVDRPQRLVDLDELTAGQPPDDTGLDAVLEHLGYFLATGNLGLHRAYLHTLLAMRAGEAQGPASVLAMLVAIGDTAAQVAQDEAAGTAEGAELTLLLTRVTADTARLVNDLIAEELARRIEQYSELASQLEGRSS